MKTYKPVFHFLKLVWGMSSRAVFFSMSQVVLKAATPIVTVWLSARLLGALTAHAEPASILSTAGMIVGFHFFSSQVQAILANRLKTLTEALKDEFSLYVGRKMMAMRYGQLESAYLQDLRQQALVPILQWGTFEFVLEQFVPEVLSGSITIGTTVLLVLHYRIWILLPILLGVFLHLVLSNLKNKRFQEVMANVSLVERKLDYYNSLSSDFSQGKDIRIFSIDQMLMRKIRDLNRTEVGAFTRLFSKAIVLDFWETVVMHLQIYFIYGVAAVDLVRKAIGIDYFFEVTGLFINLGNAMFQTMNAFVNLKARNRFLMKFMEFDMLPVEAAHQQGETSRGEPCEIIFSHVSFGYENCPDILSDVSFTVGAGSTVALVGENGAGKTTIAKLLSGFLRPREGEIYIGGRLLTGCAEQYVSAVYQDFQLFAFPVRENVQCAYGEQGDAGDVLASVGLETVVERLPHGVETCVYKIFSPDGCELSYGQGQKLATARALYKDAGVIILDEPTSAYDAKAEYEVFRDFNLLTRGKTALLISHRLWSCRSCDKILVVGEGRILEQGTHEQLMALKNGHYREMFLAQAEYYKEE